MTRTQQNREFRLISPLADDVLLFQSMTCQDRLGGLYEIDLVALSEDHAIALDDVLGKPMAVAMDVDDSSIRHFHGIVTSFAQDGMVGDLSRYRASIRPWLWLLGRSADCRIFQNKSVPDIVTEVLRDKGYTDIKKSLSGTYATREYCVQYRETDLDFIHRLLESEGIYYFFEHQKDKHTLVLADARSSHKTVSGYDTIPYFPPGGSVRRQRDHIDDWSVAQEVQPGGYSLRDYDFTRPKANLEVKSSVKRNHAQANGEFFDYPGRYVETKDGENLARARIEEFQSKYERTAGHGNARGLMTGALFTLEKYPRQDQNREYLVVSARHELESDSYQNGAASGGYRCSFMAISSQQNYRPPRTTDRPVVAGPQTAVVVGKEGEEIWTDQYGRIKVQFHWDRQGKSDENSSCWVRVAQIWAGKKWGSQFLPRIGQEVVVEFLEGDPDQPLVTGSVFNADHMPPYELPANMTQSGVKTRSTKTGNDKTFNELRFEDKKDSEQVYLHAEKNFDRVVENNETAKIGFDKKDKGDQVTEVYNDCTLSVEKGNHAVTVKEMDSILTVTKGKRTVTIKDDCSLTVESGNRIATIKEKDDVLEVSAGNQAIQIKQGDHSLKIDSGKSTIEAGTSIELKVGSSSIKIEAGKITIKSNEIVLDGGSKVDVKGDMIQAKAGGQMVLKGSMVKIN